MIKQKSESTIRSNKRCKECFARLAVIVTVTMMFTGLIHAQVLGKVRTKSGLLEGVQGNDPAVTVFKGVPFAAPPTGDLRWQPPQAPASWSGVRRADRFSSICPQRVGTELAPWGTESWMSEDCLYLNVWTAAKSSADHRPVILWFYGGGYEGGAGSQPDFDGEGLARKGAVVVTMNHRMGVLGFLATRQLSQESSHHVSGNYGLLDEIASLQWIKSNIAAFGGDPNRVTIMGQSSGAESVNLLLISPLAKGLFQRAVAESAARFPNDPAFPGHPIFWHSIQDAESDGAKFTQAQNAHSLKELRAIPWQKFNTEAVARTHFRPYVDGWVFPHNFSETYAMGLQNDVPVMMGFNRDELLGPPERLPAQTIDGYKKFLQSQMRGFTDEFMKLYPATTDKEAVQAHMDENRDAHRVSMYLLAVDWKTTAKQPVYSYFWTHAHPGAEHDYRGVYHGSEIPYFFNNLYSKVLPWEEEDHRIAEIMSSYLVNFATNGNPNGKDLPEWKHFDGKAFSLMEVGDHFAETPVAADDKFELIKRYFLAHPAQ